MCASCMHVLCPHRTETSRPLHMHAAYGKAYVTAGSQCLRQCSGGWHRAAACLAISAAIDRHLCNMSGVAAWQDDRLNACGKV